MINYFINFHYFIQFKVFFINFKFHSIIILEIQFIIVIQEQFFNYLFLNLYIIILIFHIFIIIL